MMGATKKPLVEWSEEQGIELGDIFDGVAESPIPMRAKKKEMGGVRKVGYAISGNHPAPKPLKELTEEEIERMGPPPTPTTFTDCVDDDKI